MRASVVSLSRRLLSAVFAVMLGVGLVPMPALADNGSSIGTGGLDAAVDAMASDVMGGLIEGSAVGSSFGGEGVDGSDADASVGGIINEELPLDPAVAQVESTRSYFLAQTLESTRGVPMVSAKLPVDGDAADEVVGSFTYRGITYAVEPGGESVAVVAADRAKMPTDFLEARSIILPSAVSPDGIDSYSVARIAQGAFSSLRRAAQGGEGASVSDDAEVEEGVSDERPALGSPIEEGATSGVTAIAVPSSVTSIEEGAFAGFETLQYVIVSSDNPNYSTHDGCLYDKPMESLLLIPEGRLGAVRIAPSVTNVDPEVFSHCPLVDTIVADADSAATTSENGFLYNVELTDLAYPVAVALMDGDAVVASTPDFAGTIEPVDAVFDETKVSDLILAEQSDALADQGEADRPTEESVVPESQDGTLTGTDQAVFEDVRSIAADHASHGGALPCSWTDATGTFHEITAADVAAGRGDASRAGWSFDPGSGKVSVWSAIGVTVTNLWAADSYEFAADRPTLDTLYWGPLRSRIVSVDTSQLSGATDMGCWFTGCTSLSDISAFRIPDGSRGGSVPSSLYGLFNVFTSTEDGLANLITELPPTFYLPEGVTNLHVAFGGCQNLETVYEGFAFPSTLTLGGFEGCISLKYVPGSLFSRLTDSSSLSAAHMFARCRSITTLGDGFFIPDQVVNAYNMFIDCDSLAYIPASLDMRALGTKDAHTMFADAQADALRAVPYSPLKTTYFAGSAEQLANLLPDVRTSLPEGVTADQVDTPEKYWELVYGRKLVLLNPTGDDDNVVVFIEKRMDDGIGWDVLDPQKKVDGKIDVPSTEGYYGYFLSWYADPLRTVSVPVESGKLLVGDSNKVYGLLTLVISMDMPIPSGGGDRRNTVSLLIDTTTNKVTVAGSEDEAAPVRIRSFTPVETRLSVSTKQNAAQIELADRLFDGRPTSVLVSISIGDAVYKLRLSGATYANVAKIAKATSDTDAGTVDGVLTLEIPRSVNVVPLDESVDSVDLTSVVWTVAA